MPISQSRMIALIDAANDYKQALEHITQMIRNAREYPPAHPLWKDQIGALLDCHKMEYLLLNGIESAGTIRTEADHFKRNRLRNNRRAQRLREGKIAQSVDTLTDEQLSSIAEFQGTSVEKVIEGLERLKRAGTGRGVGASSPTKPDLGYDMHGDGDPEDDQPAIGRRALVGDDFVGDDE